MLRLTSPVQGTSKHSGPQSQAKDKDTRRWLPVAPALTLPSLSLRPYILLLKHNWGVKGQKQTEV